MRIKEVIHRIHRKSVKLRLQPIRVFCFHQVSDVYDPLTMWECDWTQTELFKRNIQNLKEQGYTFISLSEAHEKLKHDWFRCKKYAVLTADDGWASLKNIVPWIVEQHIPITLFVNPAYLLGEEIRESGMDKLLTETELKAICATYRPYISIASHGWNHQLVTEQSMKEFETNVQTCTQYLSELDGYTPYFAYPCGSHKGNQDSLLQQHGLVPIYCDGQKNYDFDGVIHREPIDGMKL